MVLFIFLIRTYVFHNKLSAIQKKYKNKRNMTRPLFANKFKIAQLIPERELSDEKKGML